MFHGLVLALRGFAFELPPTLHVEVRIRRGHLCAGASEPGVEGVGEVGGLLWPVWGEVVGFVGVVALPSGVQGLSYGKKACEN